VLFICLVALAIALLVPVVTRQVGQVVDHFPGYVADAQAQVRRIAARFGQEPDFRLDAEQVRGWLAAGDNRQAVTRYITGLRSFTTSLLGGLVIVVIGPIMAFYLLVDLPRLQRGGMALVPPGRRDEIRVLMDRISQAVGGFFRGQLLVALFVGVASSLGLWAVGLPFWLLVGMVAGVFNLVPLIGPFIAGGLAVIIALVGGASFAGLFGMLVIVPLVAVAKIVFLFLWSRYVDYGDDLVAGAPG